MEEITAEALVIPEETLATRRDKVPNALTSSLQNHKLSLTPLNSTRSDLITSHGTLPSAASSSCLDVSKLHWRMQRSDSFPELPRRKSSFPVRDSGCVADHSDYDQPKAHTAICASTVINLHSCCLPSVEPNIKAETEQLLEKFK